MAAAKPLKLVSARQSPVFGYIEISYQNIEPGVVTPIMELPAGSTIIDGRVRASEAFNSTATDTIDIGDAGFPNANPPVAANPTRYKAAQNIHAIASADLGDDGTVYPAPTMLTARWNSGGGVPSAGKLVVEVTYVVRGRAHFAQGLDK